MAQYRPFNDGTTFTESDWQEALEQTAPGGGDTFSNSNGEASITVLIDANKANAARTFCLGYSWADDTSPWKLHRVTPVSHPRYGYQFRATSVSFQFFNPTANPNVSNSSANRPSPIVTDGVYRYGNYSRAYMTVHFQGPIPFYLYEDIDPTWSGKEYDRYVEVNSKPALELLNADTGAYITWEDGPAAGTRFPGSLSERLVKDTVLLTWHEVPRSFLKNSSGVAVKVEACLGRVNSTTFLGRSAGTLLLDAVDYKPSVFPFFSLDGRAFHETVMLSFVYFNPPLGTGATTTKRGWNLFPYRTGSSSGGPGWYGGNRDDGKPFIGTADFATIFTHQAS